MGTESDMEFEPIRALVPYGVLFFNTALFQILRRITSMLPFMPRGLATIILELLATVELITDCAELDIVYELHGSLAYGLVLFLLCFFWGRCWCGADACPNDLLEGHLLDSNYSWITTTCKLIGELLAARYAYTYTRFIWSYGSMPHHLRFLRNGCDGSIAVSILRGAWIEGLISFISRFVALTSSYFSDRIANPINAITTVFLVLSAAASTGGFFNPILAAGLKFRCEGMSNLGHIFVFWVSSFVGGIVARYLHLSIKEIRDKKFM